MVMHGALCLVVYNGCTFSKIHCFQGYLYTDLISSALTPHGFLHSGSLYIFVTRSEYQAACYKSPTKISGVYGEQSMDKLSL